MVTASSADGADGMVLQVGQRVFAIGFPFALDQSLTAGIVSGLGREMQSITGALSLHTCACLPPLMPHLPSAALLGSTVARIAFGKACSGPVGGCALVCRVCSIGFA